MSKFKGAIYVDIYIDDENVGDVRQSVLAKEQLREFAKKIPNAWAGNVAEMIKGDLLGNAKRIGEKL